MKLHQQIYAIIDPATDEILGDGECLCLHSSMPTKNEVRNVARTTGCKGAAWVRCYIVRAPKDVKVSEE